MRDVHRDEGLSITGSGKLSLGRIAMRNTRYYTVYEYFTAVARGLSVGHDH